MASKKSLAVGVDQLHSAIMSILEDYSEEVERKSGECVRKIAQQGAKTLRSVSPRKSGDYAGGWTYKVEQKRLGTEGTIYNSKKPGLPHLLEYGHVTRNGTGRVFDDTPAHPHIKAVEEQIISDFEKSIKGEIS